MNHETLLLRLLDRDFGGIRLLEPAAVLTDFLDKTVSALEEVVQQRPLAIGLTATAADPDLVSPVVTDHRQSVIALPKVFDGDAFGNFVIADRTPPPLVRLLVPAEFHAKPLARRAKGVQVVDGQIDRCNV